MAEYPVQCYIYDISNGLARSLSLGLVGRQIDGIWHTGIVVYGKEFFFGGGSIDRCPPGGTMLGQPQQKQNLGSTQVPEEVFMDHLRELAVTSYRADQYHLLEHNCNTFSDEVAKFLTGRGIPSHITNLPREFMETPFGQMVKPFIDSMSVNPGGQAQPLFNDLELNATNAASSQAPSSGAQAGRSQAAEPAKSKCTQLAPASFTADVSSFILNKDKIKESVDSKSFGLLGEVQEYLTKADCSWALGRSHIQVIDTILHNSSIEEPLQVATGNLLQNLFLKEDIVTQFKMDPQSKKVLYKLLQATKYYTPKMQEVSLKTLCNVTMGESFRDTLEVENVEFVSIQSLCDVCIACILHEPASAVNKYGAALMYNVTLCKKLNGEQAVSLGSAVVQLLTTSDDAEAGKYSLYGLLNCMNKNAEAVQFAAVMGLDIEGIAMDDSSLKDVKAQIKQKLLTALG